MNPLCECPMAGYCKRHKVNKTVRLHELCRGINCTPVQNAKYWDAWERGQMSDQTEPVEFPKMFKEGVALPPIVPQANFQQAASTVSSVTVGGVGTELKKLLEWFGKYADSSCSCIKHAQIMDTNGVQWCEENIDKIVGWLAEEAAKMKVAGFSLDNVPGFSWTAKMMVERAIHTCKKKVQGVVSQWQIRDTKKFLPLVGVPIDPDKLQSHILYHVMPVKGETEWVWRRHMQWLREVRNNFNGRLIVGVVTPGYNDHYQYFDVDAVKEELAGLEAEYVQAPNDVRNGVHRQGIGEGVLFPLILDKLHTHDPNQIMTYGHCKGVTRPGPPDSPSNRWAEVMFETTFRNQSEVKCMLNHQGVCGPFLMRGGFQVGLPGVGPHYFFSGTFFSMRLADVFNRDWKTILAKYQYYGCVEQFPRLLFQLDSQAGCLFFDGVNNLYDHKYWATEVEPRYQDWKNKRCTKTKLISVSD